MNHMPVRILRSVAYSCFLLAAFIRSQPAKAQLIDIQPGVSGKKIQFATGGDISMNGKCFGNLAALPSDTLSTVFGDKAGSKNGNLYFRGAITQQSGTFPGDISVGATGSTVASVTTAGAFYLSGKCVNTAGCSNTIWEPAKWNDGGTVQLNNNCYAYANDKIIGHFGTPGGACGHPYSEGPPFGENPPTVANINAAAICDGLTFVGFSFPGNTHDCGSGHLVFFAVEEGIDYHVYRYDQITGLWSSKIGPDPATQFDHGGINTITNPITADRGPLTGNAGFFCTCGELANIN